jgi:N-carbamoyl-L-amino-acid hydrolase
MQRRDAVKAMAAAVVIPPVFRWQDPAWTQWRVNGERVNRFMSEMAPIGRSPGGQVRTGFSDAVIEARLYATGLMRGAGLEVEVDPVGNIIGRRAGARADAKPILFGSHVDSVFNGGNYDGATGTMCALEVAHTLNDKAYQNRHPLWVTVWCDEERGLTGSSGFIGNISEHDLTRRDLNGGTLAEQIRRIGGDPARIPTYRHEAGSIAAYLELHIEQGGILDRTGVQIGVVEGIVGIMSWDVTITGVANHSGTTPMDERRNALLAASELALAVDRIVRARPGRQVGTVGRLTVKPSVQNIVPGEVSHSIELRDLSMEKLETLWSEIRAEGDRIMERRGTTWTHTPRPTNISAISTPAIRDVITESAGDLGLTSQVMPSGAGHDAQDLAKIGPMGMIFVPSVGGISHSPKELTKPEDIANGANVLLQTVLRLDQRLP